MLKYIKTELGGKNMPRSEKQKQKLFRLLEILMRESDESHGLSMPEIISALSEYGITAERKSIYDDIITLGELGFDVITLPTRPPKYSLATRQFEISELKMLADAVASSKFITAEKSRELIDKLRTFSGKYRAGELSRQVYVEDRVKTMNDLSVENIELINRAINENKKITYKYFDYGMNKQRVFRHDGARYLVTPLSLVRNDENYYLVAFDEGENVNKNFRIDKMAEITLTDEARSKEVLEIRFNPAEYSNKVFGMYGGREELVTLECRERLSGVIVDRFGMEHTFIKTDFGFRVSLRVMISPNFFAWVLGFGKDMRIIAPESVREEMLSRLRDTMEIYNEKI